MIKIERYIEKLLLTHDCVIIPDFGGFVTQYEPSYRVDENNAFYPPFRTISFNEQLTMNDGLLIQAYMQSYDTNYPEAMRLVKEESNRIKEVLHEQGFYHFENIGTIKLNSDSKLLFTPENECGIASPQFYGLDVLNISVFEGQFLNSDRNVGEENEPDVLQDEYEGIDDDAHESDRRKSQPYIIKLNREVTNYVAAVIAAICFYFAFSVPVSNSSSSKKIRAGMTESVMYSFPFMSGHSQDANIQSGNTQSGNVMTDTQASDGNDTQATQNDTQVKKETVETENTETNNDAEKALENNTKKENNYYTIVLASCIQEANALDFIKRLRTDGYDKAHLLVTNNMKRVVYSKYPTKEEATKALRKIKENKLFKDAWVFQVKY